MLTCMRSCIGDAGSWRCALYSVDSNHIVPVRYAAAGLTGTLWWFSGPVQCHGCLRGLEFSLILYQSLRFFFDILDAEKAQLKRESGTSQAPGSGEGGGGQHRGCIGPRMYQVRPQLRPASVWNLT